MIHLQQKGTPVDEIAYGLCLAMARNFMATVIRGREVVPPLALAGGGAANQGLVRAFAEVLGLDAESLRISPNPGGEGAVGAALSALECDAIPAVPWADVMATLAFTDQQDGERPSKNKPSPPAPLPRKARGVSCHPLPLSRTPAQWVRARGASCHPQPLSPGTMYPWSRGRGVDARPWQLSRSSRAPRHRWIPCRPKGPWTPTSAWMWDR